MTGEHFRKLSEAQVRQVINLCREGYGERNVSRVLGIPEGTVRDIFRGKTWKHVTGGRLLPNGKRPPCQLAIYREEQNA